MEFNLLHYIDRAFVNAGFYQNIPSGTIAVDGERADVLRRVDSQTYESFTDRWVMETDAVGLAGFEVLQPSGVYIDNVFHSRGSSPYEPAFDFKNGRVIFGSGVSSSAEVRMDGFSHKEVVLDLPDSDLVHLVYSKIRDNVDFTPHAFPSGNQRQFPLVVIDLQDGFNTPGEIGGNRNRNQLVALHVLGTDRHQVNAITDFLEDVQFRKVIEGVDFNDTPDEITINGDRASTYLNYGQMQASGALRWHKMYIDNARVRERVKDRDVFRTRTDWTLRLYFVPPGGG